MNVSNKHQYNIGAVARLTQIHPETIRVWERRHQVVTPERSDTGRRFYSDEDVERLLLIKQLIGAGHTISSLAHLKMQELKERLSTNQARGLSALGRNDIVCRVLFLDESLRIRLGRDLRVFNDVEVVDQFPARSRGDRASRHEVLIVGVATINNHTLTSITADIEKHQCESAVVVYNFGQQSTVKDIERSGIVCLKSPATAAEVRDACQSLAKGKHLAPAEPEEAVNHHRFSAEQLAKVATMSGSIACECPNHLAELIINLTAFEQYSGECENNNPTDALIHSQLKQSAGRARNLLEESLARLIEIEGIKI